MSSENTLVQRITQALREGRYKILLLELIVVAIGLFLGFQIDRLYEQYRDDQLAEQYIQRLTLDINADLDLLARVLRAANFRIFATETIYNSIEDSDVPIKDPNLYIRSLEQATYRFDLISENSTYTELISTGELNLLPISIRTILHSYYGLLARREQFDAAADFVQDQSYQRFAGILLPEHIEGAMTNNPDFIVTEEDALAAAQRFRENQAAIEWIPRLMAHHIGAIGEAESLIEQAEGVKVQLELFLE